MGMMSKRKGYEFERETVNYLKDGGIAARRVPLSGAGEEKGDITVQPVWRDNPYRGEAKRRRCLPTMLVSALGDHDFAVCRQDHGESLVLIRLSTFRDLLQ